jgi:hypothetical protein
MTNLKNSQKFPCEDCISLPMCKNRVDGGDLINFLCLSDLCPSFRNYIYYPPGKTKYANLDIAIEIAKNSLLKNIKFYNGLNLDGNKNTKEM